jgi:hypothetical protein
MRDHALRLSDRSRYALCAFGLASINASAGFSQGGKYQLLFPRSGRAVLRCLASHASTSCSDSTCRAVAWDNLLICAFRNSIDAVSMVFWSWRLPCIPLPRQCLIPWPQIMIAVLLVVLDIVRVLYKMPAPPAVGTPLVSLVPPPTSLPALARPSAAVARLRSGPSSLASYILLTPDVDLKSPVSFFPPRCRP